MTSKKELESRRHSIAAEASLIADPQARAEAEARNGLKQFDLGRSYIEEAIARDVQFKLRPSLVLALHREALDGLSAYAGNWRPASVAIEGSAHEPVGAHLVAGLIEELCDYINENWNNKTAIHLAAYVMWRLNWIHPFSDGNGRTSRVTSYVVLSVKMGCLLPGTKTIPDQIVENRDPYFKALESADQAWGNGGVDLDQMEDLLERLLAAQLLGVVEAASGKTNGEF